MLGKKTGAQSVTISPGRREHLFWWHRRSSLTLSSKSFSSLAVIVFLDGTVNWGSTNSIRVLKSSPSTKLIGSIYLAIIFSDVGRGLLCPSSIRLRCPDHETSHWLLLTCGWTLLRASLSNYCALQWLTYDKQASYGKSLHCTSFILSKQLQT